MYAIAPLSRLEERAMPVETLPKTEDCNFFAVRSAARHVGQFYDQFLAPIGLRTTQFSILAKLKRRGPLTINALAKDMVMDRTTLGRNVLPLERDGLIRIEPIASDRRAKELHLTNTGENVWTARQYLTRFALPNFYFHITTAYDILRHNGVALGKRDYIGNMVS